MDVAGSQFWVSKTDLQFEANHGTGEEARRATEAAINCETARHNGNHQIQLKFFIFLKSNANETGKSFGTHWADARIHWEWTPTVGAAADAEEVPAVMIGGPKSRSSKSKLSSLGFSSGFASFAAGFVV